MRSSAAFYRADTLGDDLDAARREAAELADTFSRLCRSPSTPLDVLASAGHALAVSSGRVAGLSTLLPRS